MRVAIVGGPGIGKSTLVRQLGDLYHNGSYGEGEEGDDRERLGGSEEELGVAGRNAPQGREPQGDQAKGLGHG